MEVLNQLFRRARGGISSGCIMVGGKESMGPEELFLTLAEEACMANRLLIILDAKQDKAGRIELINRIGPHITRGAGYVFSPDVGSRETFDAFDFFSACSTAIDKAGLLADLLIMHSMNPSYRSEVVTYFQYVLEMKRSSRLKDILSIDPRSAIAMLSPSDSGYESKRVFIDSFRTRVYGNVIAAINILVHSPEASLMGGSLKLDRLLHPGNVIVVSDDPPMTGDVNQNGLFQSVLLALMSCIKSYGITDAVILLRHADLIAPYDLEALMDTAHSNRVLFVWMPEKIAKFIDAGGPVLEKVDYLSVFKTDKITAESWANMFGHRERKKVTATNTSPKGILFSLGFGSIATGGLGVPQSSWRGSRSVTTSNEDKQNVTADQISTLRPGMAWNLYPDGSFSQGRI